MNALSISTAADTNSFTIVYILKIYKCHWKIYKWHFGKFTNATVEFVNRHFFKDMDLSEPFQTAALGYFCRSRVFNS